MIQDTAGIRHLRKLSDAGLTHVHLLPSFQFGGVDDIKNNWKFVGKDSFFLYILPVKDINLSFKMIT